MTATYNISPQSAFKKQYAETIHNNVTVNSSSSTTLTWMNVRTLELNADVTAWSNGTSGTATIQFTLTRIRPDGSEAGSVVGPIMSTLGSRKIRIELHASDSVKVSWTIAGGSTSYPVMKTTLGTQGVATVDRRLRTIEKPTYMMAGSSNIAEGRPYWILEVSTDGNDQFASFANGYLDLTSFSDHDKPYYTKMITGTFPAKMTFECEVSFGDSAATLDYTDGVEPLFRSMGFFGGVFVGFRTYGAGVLRLQAGSFTKDTLTLEPKRYRLKVVVSHSQIEWHVDGRLIYSAPARGIGVVDNILRGEAIGYIHSAQGTLGGSPFYTNRPFYIYWIRVYSDDKDHLTFEEGIRRKVTRVNSSASALIPGVAATQGLGTVLATVFNTFKRIGIRRACVTATAAAAAATVVGYRFVTGTVNGGTQTSPTRVRLHTRSPRWGDETVNDWGSFNYRTGGFGSAAAALWVGVLGAQMSNAQGTTPTPLEIVNIRDPLTWYGLSTSWDVTTNDTDWRHVIYAEWEELF